MYSFSNTNKTTLTSIALVIANTGMIWGADHHHQHDAHVGHKGHRSPMSIMGAHQHQKGEWMFSYQHMSMAMDDMFSGSSKISTAQARAMGTEGAYTMVPTDMDMDMNMFSLMYAPTSNMTLMLMTHHQKNTMNVQRMNGISFETESSGITDTQVALYYGFNTPSTSTFQFGLGLSLPTGSIDEKDDTPMTAGVEIALPYAMQLGSGTHDLLPSLTYAREFDSFSWGAQIKGVFRLEDNKHDYRFGDEVTLQTWATYHWCDAIGSSLKLKGEQWRDVKGQDPALAGRINMMPTANPDRFGGQRLDVALGLQFDGEAMGWRGHKASLEYSTDLHQDLNGPQLGITSSWSLGYQKTW
jgi:hypothetical protein